MLFLILDGGGPEDGGSERILKIQELEIFL